MMCEVMAKGTWTAVGECVEGYVESTGGSAPVVDGPPAASSGGGMGNMQCLMAPEAMGAAHMAAYSSGWSFSCPNTPGQESPYMWPLSWSADYERHSMETGNDDVVFNSKGKVYYMLDRNFKRSDATSESGFEGTIGMGPCPDGEYAMLGDGCLRNSTTLSTMIHKGSLVYFLAWKEGTEPGETGPSKIEYCRVTDLQIVGNLSIQRQDQPSSQYQMHMKRLFVGRCVVNDLPPPARRRGSMQHHRLVRASNRRASTKTSLICTAARARRMEVATTTIATTIRSCPVIVARPAEV